MENTADFQSYFWLRAPADAITLKKEKKYGDLKTLFSTLAKSDNKIAQGLCCEKSEALKSDPHLTIFEQPRSLEENGVFRYQPIQDVEQLVNMTGIIQDVAADYDPFKLGGRGMECLEKGTKFHLAFNFNDEAVEKFQDFHRDLMDELSEEKVCDLYLQDREPRILLSKAYKNRFKKHDLKAGQKSINEQFYKLRTKPIHFDRMILGQGFFDIHGHHLASRDISTVYFDERPFEWHCDDPFDKENNQSLIADQKALREMPDLKYPNQIRAQGQVNARPRPLLVS
ncbi:MAG: hypothetical protein COB76_02250 [Alphaproteobacteria bacterium]|nr:MAG: hypothetical protein COB76_02250 [Alphaproteobacteria bacterium]